MDAGLDGYALDGGARAALDARLTAFARARVEAHVREAANTALPRMKARQRAACAGGEAASDGPNETCFVTPCHCWRPVARSGRALGRACARRTARARACTSNVPGSGGLV